VIVANKINTHNYRWFRVYQESDTKCNLGQTAHSMALYCYEAKAYMAKPACEVNKTGNVRIM